MPIMIFKSPSKFTPPCSQSAPLDIMPIISHLESHDEDYVVRLIWRDQFEGFARQSDMPGLLYLDPKQHAYYFADNPHIRKREYIDILGKWEDSMVMGIVGIFIALIVIIGILVGSSVHDFNTNLKKQ